MGFKKYASIAAALLTVALTSELTNLADILGNASDSQNNQSAQPTAIYHAFNQNYADIEGFACALAEQGYSHLQISPAQKSNPGSEWWKRYQPYDLSVIEELGSKHDLQQLITTAHRCNLKIIADVVFNHMANLDSGEDFEDLSKYPNLSAADFHTNPNNVGARLCGINYNDGNRDSELNCWLGGLPDLRFTNNVKTLQKAHLDLLLDLGVDGFRFDAAKHIPTDVMGEYIAYINQQSQGNTWNYLEVISDSDTRGEDYSSIAAVTDFVLYNSMKGAFTFGGDLRALPAAALDDSRSVTFGTNHDTIRSLNTAALNPYDDITDSYLATAYVLARESGTPLIFSADHANSPFIKTGVKFRQIMQQRQQQGLNTQENILRVLDSSTVLLMERGAEGFFVENKGTDMLNLSTLDLTLSNLDGCYRELRNNFTVAIEQRGDKKYVTRWGTWNRGGLEIIGRDALYFVRESFDQCDRP
ncbi:MAG: alpha-amylase family glycosyl hydrolase [Cyanobacteria bacterium J06560_2]